VTGNVQRLCTDQKEKKSQACRHLLQITLTEWLLPFGTDSFVFPCLPKNFKAKKYRQFGNEHLNNQ